ncbi:MAG TPA: hypothetical protein VJ546_09810 [Bacillales bacterium]|nr:hypothetical protein [Bacillales bacterium]
MKEMELFVEMLDDKEANKILTFFNESPPGTRKNNATLEQKKIHLKKVFKSMTPHMIRQRRNRGPDPFYTYLSKYKFPENPTEKFNEMIIYMNELNDRIPSFFRFANILIQFPEEIKNHLNQIEINLRDGKNPLDLGFQFNSIDEVKEFLRKTRSYLGEDAPKKIIKDLEDFQVPKYKTLLKECENQIKDYDLLQYYMENNRLNEKYGLSICNAAYILTHENEDQDILLSLAIEGMYYLLGKQKDEAIADFENKLNNALSGTKAEEEYIKKMLSEKNDEVSNLKNELKQLQKMIKKLEKEKDEQINRSNKLEREHNDEYEKISLKLEENQTKESQLIIKYDKKLKTIQQELEIKNLIDAERKEKFYSDLTFTSNWGIICMTDHTLTKEIFPELLLAQADSKKECQSLLENPNINTIYLIMKGLSSKRFRTLKQEVEKHRKILKTIDFETFKEFIEWIGYMKTLERNAVTQ